MAVDVAQLLTLSNPVFRTYLFYSGVLVVKVLGVVGLIGRQRFRKQIFRSPEDCTLIANAKVKNDDPDIERPRRAHMNDLENIPFFFVAGFSYLLTNPDPWLAITLFRTYTLARIAHTFVYAVVVVPQPARAIAWAVGYGITIYMSLVSIKAFY